MRFVGRAISPAVKGRDKTLDAAEAAGGGGDGPAEANAWIISPLQGLLPQKDGLCFETQAVGLGFS